MIEYAPWSRMLLDKSLQKYQSGVLNILDIELGGACNFDCIYCDTPSRSTLCKIPMREIEKVLDGGNIDFVFICGLGEPSFATNYPHLVDILRMCKTRSIGCSIFSNIYAFTDELFDFVADGTLNVLFKLDSFDEQRVSKLYHCKNPKQQLDNVQRIKSCVVCNDGMTNVAASIVPTTENIDEVFSLMQFCYDNNIFPLVGDLEDSGAACGTYSSLKVNSDILFDIRKKHIAQYGEDYLVPICPATISAIHIGHDSQIITDERTGLSCPWFWLTEPQMEHLATFSNSEQIEGITKQILTARTSRLPIVEELSTQYTPLPFGGCGGDIQELLARYIHAHKLYIKSLE